VYILLSHKDGNFYIGYTADLHQRLTSHIRGNSFATSFRRPFELIFCEYFKSKSDSLNREKYFKTTKGKRVLRLMLQDSLQEVKTTPDIIAL
jgi:putative endonuclease